MVKRSQDAERDISYLIKAMDIVGETWCSKNRGNCYKCPLGKLGVFDNRTCNEFVKLISRLELVYKVVETL